jgi:hypothetical protein
MSSIGAHGSFDVFLIKRKGAASDKNNNFLYQTTTTIASSFLFIQNASGDPRVRYKR